MVRRTGIDVSWDDDRDLWWHDVVDSASPDHTPEPFEAEQPLFLLYTSGTTGKPKGVMIEHAAIANLVRGDLATFPTAPGDRVAQNSSCAYDSSVEEIWMALAAGA